MLRRLVVKVVADGTSFNHMEKESGVLRQVLMNLGKGKGGLRADSCDKLANYFGLALVKRKKG